MTVAQNAEACSAELMLKYGLHFPPERRELLKAALELAFAAGVVSGSEATHQVAMRALSHLEGKRV